jgi:hypothetical protein
MKIGKTEIMALIDDFEKLDQRLSKVIAEQKWKKDDIRVTCFHKFKNTVHISKMNLFFLANCILEKGFWHQISESNVSDTDLKIWSREYEVNTRFSLFHILMSVLEASLRVIVRGIDPNACGKGTSNFESIYKWLLRKLQIANPNNENLLDLCRVIRNSIHNGGIYCPANPNYEYVKIEYCGTMYEFKNGKPVDFLFWPFLILITNHIVDLFINTVSSSEMETHVHIPDPAIEYL